jgi:hypothetical protein
MAINTRKTRNIGGFTLIEVTFATGILFLTLVLLLGALAHLALVREMGERRHLATLCLNHCVELWRATPGQTDLLRAPDDLPGEYAITLAPADTPGLARIVVTTHTSRGHRVTVSAPCVIEDPPHAP